MVSVIASTMFSGVSCWFWALTEIFQACFYLLVMNAFLAGNLLVFSVFRISPWNFLNLAVIMVLAAPSNKIIWTFLKNKGLYFAFLPQMRDVELLLVVLNRRSFRRIHATRLWPDSSGSWSISDWNRWGEGCFPCMASWAWALYPQYLRCCLPRPLCS